MIPGWTGLLAAGLAANQILAAIRNVGPGELIVDSVEMGFITTTVATAAASVAFGFYKVTGFTALSNAGARVAEPVPVRKRNSQHRVLPFAFTDVADDTAVQVEVANTAGLSGLTGGAALFDDPLDTLICRSVLAATTPTYLYEGACLWQPRNGIPFTLGPDEGLVFANLQAFPAALVGRFGIHVDVRLA